MRATDFARSASGQVLRTISTSASGSCLFTAFSDDRWDWCCLATDPTTAENFIATITNRRLAWRYGALRSVQLNPRAPLCAGKYGRRSSWMSIADFHLCLKGSCRFDVPKGVTNLEFLDHEIIGIANNDAAVLGIDVDDIARSCGTAGQSFSLANGEQLDAGVLAQTVAV